MRSNAGKACLRVVVRAACLIVALDLVWTACAQHSGLHGFSPDFLGDYQSAQKKVDDQKSAGPLLALLQKYANEVERAELQVSIGLVYGQRTGVVDPAKAVVHFTEALKYELPEWTHIEILMWRGNAQEQLKKKEEALKDYLRGLLACSYHDLSGGWPADKPPKLPIYINDDMSYPPRGPDLENAERIRDYNRYRKMIRLQQDLMGERYYFVEAVKRVAQEQADRDARVREILEGLSPDFSRHSIIINWLNAENKRPWP